VAPQDPQVVRQWDVRGSRFVFRIHD
jgi:hypothetical protein